MVGQKLRKQAPIQAVLDTLHHQSTNYLDEITEVSIGHVW